MKKMLSAGSSDLPTIQIKEGDKFFTRLKSRESASLSPTHSFRVYYGGLSGSVPFKWESQPGTPKHPATQLASIPPLTPPPSYYYYPKKTYQPPTKKKATPHNLLCFLFPRNHTLFKKGPPSSSSSSPSILSSSSWSSSRSSLYYAEIDSSTKDRRKTRFYSFDSGMEFDDDDHDEPHGSTLCFGLSRGKKMKGVGGCYRW